MCLAMPARIAEVIPGPLPMARLDGGAGPGTCCLAYVPAAARGDWVLVRHGFAVEVLDAGSAAKSLAAFAELGIGPAGANPAGIGTPGAANARVHEESRLTHLQSGPRSGPADG
jgi:hydrogenase expression/formation protein HypC